MATGISTAAPIAAGTTRLFRDDVLKGSPRDDRKDEVVEREKPQVTAGFVGDAGADPADDDRDGQRQEEQREKELTRPAGDRHRREQGADRADPDVRERNAGDRRGVDPGEEERERGQRDELGD